MRTRPLLLSLTLILVTIAAGLATRFAPLGLPSSVVKYGGSALWALMVYWIVSIPVASRRVAVAAVLAGVVATAVEFVKLYHWPALDAFRRTLPGVLLLGRFFSGWDIAVYCVAICIGAIVDRSIRQRRLRP